MNLPFSCPISLGHPKARRRCSQGERMLLGRVGLRTSALSGSKNVREEPGKQKPRSCWAQELARSSARKIRGRKRLHAEISENRDESADLSETDGANYS